jgi:hypothetical protein
MKDSLNFYIRFEVSVGTAKNYLLGCNTKLHNVTCQKVVLVRIVYCGVTVQIHISEPDVGIICYLTDCRCLILILISELCEKIHM